MKSIVIKAKSGYSRVLVGRGLAGLSHLVESEQKVLVVDESVSDRYGSILPDWPLLTLPGGEDSKSLTVVQRLYEEFMDLGIDRGAHVVGVGGGTICDVVGYAAATYLRGVKLGLVPTTLLAQVDASVGGKNGVNFGGFKNQIGTIRQPEFVLCDPLFLKTVPEREIRSGFAEVIKAALISDSRLFELLASQRAQCLALDADVLEKVLFAALTVKAAIVEADETEKKERVKLNFGHSIGHAVESVLQIPHGEAVSIGLVAEARLSEKHAGFTPEDTQRLVDLLNDFGLPTAIEADAAQLVQALRRDKKRRSAQVKMALLQRIGISELVSIPLSELEDLLHVLCQHS